MDAVATSPERSSDQSPSVAGQRETQLDQEGNNFDRNRAGEYLGLSSSKSEDIHDDVANALCLPPEEARLKMSEYLNLTQNLPEFKVYDWALREACPHLLRPDQKLAATELLWSQRRLLDLFRVGVSLASDISYLRDRAKNNEDIGDPLEDLRLTAGKSLILFMNAIEWERHRLVSLMSENIISSPTPKDIWGMSTKPALSVEGLDDLVYQAKRAQQARAMFERRNRSSRGSGRSRRGRRRPQREGSSLPTTSANHDKAPQSKRRGESF